MRRQPHILITDDDGFVRDSIDHIAKQLGYKTTLAKNGKEALQQAQKNIFDLIISDLYMPELDGNELVRSIKSMPEYKNVPFLFLSGSSERKTWIKNLNAGADDFITKPFDKKILALKLRSHIKRYFTRKELLKSNMEYNINLREGIVIYCTSKDCKFRFDPKGIVAEVKKVYSSTELFNNLEKLNAWLLLIDSDAVSHFDINRIKLSSNIEFPIIYLTNELEEVTELIDEGIGNFILKSLPKKLFYHQINSLITREIELKNKYINAIKLAANNSLVRFERESEQVFNDYFVSVLHEPYEFIPGGDFYELFTAPNKEIMVIVVGDVMGKQWSAWFFVSAYLAYIRSAIHFLLEITPTNAMTSAYILEHINKMIARDLKIAEVFTTLSIIIIHKEGTLNIAAAGAMQPVLYKNNDGSISQLNITGMLLGISEKTEYQLLEMELEPLDKLLFFSDGYTETLNSKTGKMLSAESIISTLKTLGKDKKMNLTDFEKTLVDNYHITSFDDDRTLLSITRT